MKIKLIDISHMDEFHYYDKSLDYIKRNYPNYIWLETELMSEIRTNTLVKHVSFSIYYITMNNGNAFNVIAEKGQLPFLEEQEKTK